MANVDVTIAMDPTYQPYERPPDPATLWTAIPRGLRGFVVELGILTAKPVNDTETLALTATLPANFAYVFAEISLRLSQDRADDWRAEYTMNLQSWYQGLTGVSTSFTYPFQVHGLSLDERANGHQSMDHCPRAPMWAPRGSSGILINITAANSKAAAAAAGTLSAYVNFWEFDLEQARKYPINAPIPTHSR